MSRIHSGRKGKSGSKKPLATTPPGWLSYKPEEVKELVLKLAKQGHQTSKIGLVLRDQYGIPDVHMITKEKITQILEGSKLKPAMPEDIQNLIKKAIGVKKHLERHKKDEGSIRGLHLIESKIKRLEKYYKRSGRLPEKWSYEPEKAKLLG